MYLGLLLAFCAAAAQVAGGYIVLRRAAWPKRWERSLLALSAGFLLALVFIDLIPTSFHLTLNTELSALLMLLGFSTLHFFEHTVVEHMHFGEETHADVAISHSSAFGAVGGLAVHAFFDGVAISAAASASEGLGWLVFFAVLLHKIPEGLTVASVMVASDRSRKEASYASLMLALSTIAGAILVFFFTFVEESWVGMLFAFSAGSSLYIGACDLIPEINKTKGRTAPLLVFLGILLFWGGREFLTLFIGHVH